MTVTVGPDLRIVEFSWFPAVPVPGVWARFDYTIRNFGGAPGDFVVLKSIDGALQAVPDVSRSLDPGAMYSSSWFPPLDGVGEHEVRIAVRVDGEIVDERVASVRVQDFGPQLLAGGRTYRTNIPIFGVVPDDDEDGISDLWEFDAAGRTRPLLEMDEEEDLFEHDDHHIALLTRVTPFLLEDHRYVIFFFMWAFSRDYGRYSLFTDHNGDTEGAIMAWKVVDDYTIELRWVYTSAHGAHCDDHRAVWSPYEETLNWGNVCGAAGVYGPCDRTHVESFSSTLYFVNNTLKLWCSEDKHALYPSSAVCEDVTLVWPFFGEDCGGGATKILSPHNVGEPWHPLIDEFDDHPVLGQWFPGEAVWSEVRFYDGKAKFCGGLECEESSPGPIGRGLRGLPCLLREKLEEETGERIPGELEEKPVYPD